jgi:hypothetical protein
MRACGISLVPGCRSPAALCRARWRGCSFRRMGAADHESRGGSGESGGTGLAPQTGSGATLGRRRNGAFYHYDLSTTRRTSSRICGYDVSKSAWGLDGMTYVSEAADAGRRRRRTLGLAREDGLGQTFGQTRSNARKPPAVAVKSSAGVQYETFGERRLRSSRPPFSRTSPRNRADDL